MFYLRKQRQQQRKNYQFIIDSVMILLLLLLLLLLLICCSKLHWGGIIISVFCLFVCFVVCTCIYYSLVSTPLILRLLSSDQLFLLEKTSWDKPSSCTALPCSTSLSQYCQQLRSSLCWLAPCEWVCLFVKYMYQ